MPDHAAYQAIHPHHRGSLPKRIVLAVWRRLWSLALIALVLWLSYEAFAYLVISLIYPSAAPPQVLDLPLRANKTMLQSDGSAFVGFRAVENPRAPLGHYHRIDDWFQPDPQNNCTQSGCHAPLPHGRNKADRAFLNMHATSLHCGVCHIATDKSPLPLTWYDLKDGAATDTPALLKAYTVLEKLGPQATYDDQREFVRLVREACTAGDSPHGLGSLAQHLEAVRPGSEEWGRLVEYARQELPRHFRGEYGAKIALINGGGGKPTLGHPGNESAVKEFRERGDKLSESDRAALLARIHPQRRSPTLHCAACHAQEGSLVDLAALGYPTERIHQLTTPLITQMIDHIVAGQIFQMPSILAPQRPGASESQDAP